MSDQTPEGLIAQGLANLAAVRVAQRKVAEELAADRDRADASRPPVVPAEVPVVAPEQRGA